MANCSVTLEHLHKAHRDKNQIVMYYLLQALKYFASYSYTRNCKNDIVKRIYDAFMTLYRAYLFLTKGLILKLHTVAWVIIGDAK